jgi:hypothetical protein
MTEKETSLQALHDIRSMMERSSRFISLSGLSGIAAGCCALAGGFWASRFVYLEERGYISRMRIYNQDERGWNAVDPGALRHFSNGSFLGDILQSPLFHIAIITFMGAFASSFFFTWLKSRKQGIPVWGTASKRLMWNVAIPLVAGGLFIYRMMELGNYGLVAPGCLVFYGLALLNASKYTLVEIRYLGLAQVVLGLINCWYIGYGLYFWMAGFGVLHILYGIYMWWKYERNTAAQA